jgi:predicted CXXCH cytochrome family protein
MQNHPLRELKHQVSNLCRRHPHAFAALTLTGSSISLAIFLNACSSTGGTVFSPPAVPGAVFVGNKACADCHAGIVQKFPTSPHARLHFAPDPKSGASGCESCHGPGSLHIQAGGGRKFIVNPGKDPSACFQCHLETHAEFSLPQHHPVIEGRMNCVQCHDPHGTDIMKPAGNLAMARLNESCANCHQQQTRPFVFEHEAMRDGCVVCHNPHGSVNRKLLVQNDPNLCLRCHAQVQDPANGSGVILIGGFDHTTFLNRATCWSAGCHTAVHGSNVDPWLRY